MTKIFNQAYWYYDELEDVHCNIEDVRDSFSNMMFLMNMDELSVKECEVMQEVMVGLEQLDNKMTWLLEAGNERSLARLREQNSDDVL